MAMMNAQTDAHVTMMVERLRRRGPVLQAITAAASGQPEARALEEWLAQLAAQAVGMYAALVNGGNDARALEDVRQLGGMCVACLESQALELLKGF